jgi:hypothetical protein
MVGTFPRRISNPWKFLVLLLAAPALAASERGGINLSGICDWNTELPFVDLAKSCRPWVSQRTGAAWGKGPALELDERGWVRRLEPGCFADIPFLVFEQGHAPAGDYVCLYDGRGRLAVSGGPKAIEEKPGRLVVRLEPGAGQFWLQLRETDPADPVRNIRMLLPGTESAHEREPFNPSFLARWSSMKTLRFMDWMDTNGSRQERWADRPQPADANWSTRGVPVEVMVDLCNRAKKDAWFCLPHRADDDYVRQFAAQVRDHLDPGLKVYIEYSNELWNGMFEQTRYCEQRGMALRLADKPWEAGWHYSAQRSVEVFSIWEEVFGGRDRLVRVMATQAANPHIAEVKLGHADAAKRCDALAIAPYVSFNVSPSGPPSAAEVAGWSPEQVLDHLERMSLPQSREWIRKHKAIADRHGLALIAYEAGQHAVGVQGGENNEALTQLLRAANRHPRMGDLYRRHLADWDAAGGGLVCLFASTSSWSKWGSWGLLEFADDPPDRPKFRAVMDWAR